MRNYHSRPNTRGTMWSTLIPTATLLRTSREGVTASAEGRSSYARCIEWISGWRRRYLRTWKMEERFGV